MTGARVETWGETAAVSGVWPRVTAIMPTRDRRAFVTQALRCFARQDYPNLELLVIDDGRNAVSDLIPDADPRIRYVRLDRVHSVGAKRNLACRQATGELIAHWDDDDWSAPSRLRRQVSSLLASGADLCGLVDVVHYRMRHGDAWVPGPGADRIEGASIVYRRSVWESSGFADVNRGEDSAFVGSVAPELRTMVPGAELMIVVEHGGNTSGRSLAQPPWRPVPLDGISSLLVADRTFYSGLRSDRGELPRPPREDRIGITVAAAFDVFSGYGTTAEYLTLSLARAGATVSAVPLGLNRDGLTDEILTILDGPPAPVDQPTIYHSWIRGDIAPFHRSRELFISTMWEADRFPPRWVPELQRAAAVIVPSRFVADSCRASGVSRPVIVVPQGIDPAVYCRQRRPERDGLVTLIVAPVDGRKHTRLAIAAWKAAFGDDPDARLVIKTTYGYHNYTPDDPRISYVDRVESTRGIVDYYRDADVLMALGSEGFGLPLVEGMATGLPVVALDAEGQHDVCADAGDAGARGTSRGARAACGRRRRARPACARYRTSGAWSTACSGSTSTETRPVSWAGGVGLGDGPSKHLVDGAGCARRRPAPSLVAPAVRHATDDLGPLGRALPAASAESVDRLHRNMPSVRRVSGRAGAHAHGNAALHVQHEPGIFDDAASSHDSRPRPGAECRSSSPSTPSCDSTVGGSAAPTRWSRPPSRARCG